MEDLDLCYLPATVLARAIKSKEVSPVEVTAAVLARIEALEPKLNAFATFTPELALTAARAAEKAVTAGDELGDLHGVPVSIKDLTLTAGIATQRGSRIQTGEDPTIDAPVVTRIKQAGGIVLGKTTTPEFGWKGVTDNPLTGITRNAWNPERTPGGSSGGAAAAAGAFMGPLHQGSDAAGSIRIPAAFSGVFGYKPTFGVVPNYPLPGHIGSLANMGPITRTVRDAVVMLNVLAQPDFRDFMAPPVQGRNYFDGLEDGVAGLRIAYSPTLGSDGWADDDVANAVAAAVKVFEALGATVEQVDPDIPACRPIIETIWFAADAWIVDQMGPEKAQLMDPGLLAVAEQGRNLSVQDLVGAHAARVDLGVRMARFHQTYDLLLTPQMPLEAFEAGKNYPDGRDMSEWVDWSPFTYPFNLSMQPAASVPCGFGDDGMPVAFQLVGRRFDDATVLRAARAYERAHPFKMPEGYV